MIQYTSTAQLGISEFSMPFECNLSPDNRWVRLSKIVEWDVFAREYYKNFSSQEGRTPIDARVILYAVIIKHFYVLSDIDTIEMIKENPYLQFLLETRVLVMNLHLIPLSLSPFASVWVKSCSTV